jgi:nicotinamide-nucleotide amidase
VPAEPNQRASELVRLLSERGLTLATAEATTGGLIGHLIVAVPGSSAVFRAGVAPYSNTAKIALGVDPEVLATRGAVSEEAAAALATAVRRWAGTDIGLAETGIAGPSGGTAARPAGTFWVAVDTGQRVITRQFQFDFDRPGNQGAAADAAIRLLLEPFADQAG